MIQSEIATIINWNDLLIINVSKQDFIDILDMRGHQSLHAFLNNGFLKTMGKERL